ncbi:42553_t:CDS:2 [Gigaspora margarita]|uniref:42553_t:CDS:1 n=1 Tax=Gigaspora margarita TaxID=4874 RepID=A0ABN7WLV8_GIGMA|nr:42553_t:CDS:2 [Gigaspora margarita]
MPVGRICNYTEIRDRSGGLPSVGNVFLSHRPLLPPKLFFRDDTWTALYYIILKNLHYGPHSKSYDVVARCETD